MASPFQTSAPAPEETIPGHEEAARKAEVTAQLKHLHEPTLGNDLVSLGMVRHLRVVGDYVYLRLYVGAHQLALQGQVEQYLQQLPWVKKVYVQLCTIPGVRTTLAIASGKGGVGKSTTAVQLAIALTRTGARVGLLDADIYGPNVPHLLGLSKAQVEVVETPEGQRFVPLEVHGLKLMSVGLLADPDHPLAWRGPVLHKILTQFIQQVAWGELDYLLVDLPPGTGDAQITLVQESPICGVIMVTTPHAIALADLRRSIHMFRQVGVPVLGLIENMSYLVCPCCNARTPIFGSGGGAQIAAELSVPLWGQVPIDPGLSAAGEAVPTTASHLKAVFDPIAQGLNRTFEA
ncbi:P-loop NTPase [Nodosilinea sp. PGN35]|uniref:Mrp/NBP35 family ATP-binding protein n=1 Tax=Nodosilinea sp. PGN35 TaxID=3020489 RepID=UPI0023B2B43E|nr:Mrp/NBP35 family ATP-binding protein [Nodosilinea sp. TSF1-S3]